MKKKICRFYVDGVRRTGDVLKMALAEYITLQEMKEQLKKRYGHGNGHNVKFVVE